ncbi:hypothetical protein ACJIZ3_022515 [Penstemon smallii]|uniref:TPX2 central domain-containing protein n=1 Tax=Penstemon smallii TaxID=265156 RepID=A0ABD3TLF8_9LAMI
MEEETQDFIDDYYEVPEEETDEEYEFEASQFFDFMRPEFDYEIEEAERWFELSGDYGPSPFIVKLNLEKLFSMHVVSNTSHGKGSNNTRLISSNSDIESRHGVSTSKTDGKGKSCHMLHDAGKAKTKSPNKLLEPRTSTLMKPTASHLAKQNKLHDMHSKYICTRIHKTTDLNEKSLQSPTDNLATKRQKLETGYLRKIAHLKHHTSLLHKSPKKVTIPREPELETLLRAQRRSSKNSSASSESAKEKGCIFKAHPLNRKVGIEILLTPVMPRPRKSTQQLPEFQVFHLKTMERANQHASSKVSNANVSAPCVSSGATNSKRSNSRETLKPDKQEALLNSKACFLREKVSKSSTGDKFLGVLPIEQFSQLSLGSDLEANNASQPERRVSNKELKENAPISFQSKLRTSLVKPNQFRGHLTAREARCWSNVTRSLDIR